MKKLGIAAAVLALAVATASAAVSFKIGPTFNSFADTRITGMSTGFTIGFDLDKFSLGYKVEQQNLQIADAANSASNMRFSNQLQLLCFDKEIASVSKDVPVSVGLEIGSMQSQSLPGTIAACAALSQVAPVIGINGGIKYENAGKSVSTAFYANIGYRFIDITDVTAATAGFVATGERVKSLDGMRMELGVAVTF